MCVCVCVCVSVSVSVCLCISESGAVKPSLQRAVRYIRICQNNARFMVDLESVKLLC